MIRNFATFTSSLPDDSVEEEGEVVVPCGRSLMDLIRTAFRHFGYGVTEIEQHSSYGWFFDATGAEGRFWLMIQYPDPWLLMIQDSRPAWKRTFSGKADFERFINWSHAIVQSVSEISELRWVTEREWQEVARKGNLGSEHVVGGSRR